MNRVIRTLLTASLSFVARIMRAYSARVTANGGVVEATACATSTLTSLDSKSLLQSATFVLAPSGYKSGVIYSQVPSNGNGDLTVTRATTATRVNSAGLIETVASGVPQLDYSLGGCPNFLFEPQRRNSILQSQNFDSASWSKARGSITPNTSIAPDGLNTADILSGDGTGTSYVFQQLSVTNGVSIAISIYVKPINSTTFNIQSFTQAGFASFTLTGIGSISSPTGVLSNSKIEALQNGWYRCSVILTPTSTVSNNLGFGVINYNGQICSLWGAQFEDNGSNGSVNYPTSYIPTTSAAVTRNSTVITRSNIYNNGLIGSIGGTWLIEFRNNVSYTRDTTILGIYISDASVYNAIGINNFNNTLLSVRKYVSGILTTIYTTDSENVKLVIKWYNDGSNKVDVFANGVKVVNGSSFFDSTLLSSLTFNNSDVPKYMSQMALWNTPLSDAQCISLSSYTTFEVAKQLLDKVIADAIADGGTYKQSNYDASIDKIVKVMEAFGTTNIASKMVAWVDPEYLPYRQSTEAGTASSSGCRKLYDLFRRADFTQTTPASMPLLLLHSGENYWANSSGNNINCATSVSNSMQFNGDFTIEFDGNLDSATNGELCGKAAGSDTVALAVSSSGLLTFRYYNGSSFIVNVTSSASITPTTRTKIRLVRNGNNYLFYTSVDGVTWTQLGTTQTSAGVIPSITAVLRIGNGGLSIYNPFIGKCYRCRFWNDSTQTNLVADFNPQSFNPSTSQTQWTSVTGEVWTINTGTASTGYKGALVYRNMIMADGIDDAMASGNVTIGGQQVGIYSSSRVLNNVTATSTFLELSNSSASSTNSFCVRVGTGSVRRLQVFTNQSNSLNNTISNNDPFTSKLQILSSEIDTSLLAANENKLYSNLAQLATNSPTQDQTFSFTIAYPLNLFAMNNSLNYSNMSLHDLILVTDITKRTEMENIIRSMSSNFAF